jgi:hypothetical protein
MMACAPKAFDLDSDKAKVFQEIVLSISQAVADADRTRALRSLDELELELEEAAGEGQVSFKRYQNILSSLEAVRKDLVAEAQAEVKAEEVAAEGAPQTTTPDSDTSVASPQPTPAPLPLVTADESVNEKGKGQGKAQGKGQDGK